MAATVIVDTATTPLETDTGIEMEETRTGPSTPAAEVTASVPWNEDTSTARVTLEAVTGVVIEEMAGSVETPTGAGGFTFVATSKTTELTTAVEKKTTPVSKRRVSAFTVMLETVTGFDVTSEETDTGIEIEETANGPSTPAAEVTAALPTNEVTFTPAVTLEAVTGVVTVLVPMRIIDDANTFCGMAFELVGHFICDSNSKMLELVGVICQFGVMCAVLVSVSQSATYRDCPDPVPLLM
jgi:hypothetical protein